MVVDSRNSGSVCQYPELEIREHNNLTSRELEYFKNDKNELKNRSAVEGIIGGGIILIGLFLLMIFFLGVHSPILIFFAFMMLFMGGAFCYNAITVKGTTEERFKKGEIKAAIIRIPNVYFIRYFTDYSDNHLESGHFYIKRCCTGTYNGKQHIVALYKRNSSGQLIATSHSISEEIEREASSYVGKCYLAKLTYARGKLFEIEVFLDEMY